MRLSAIAVVLLCLVAGCRRAEVVVTPRPGSELYDGRGMRAEAYPSPDGRAVLIHADSSVVGRASLDRVLLVAGGDTTEAFSWNLERPLGIEWLGPDLGRIWLGIGGNHNHASVFVEASSGRVSPALDDDVAVDGAAGTVVTFDGDRFTLRALWSGRALASWAPADVDLLEMWQGCEPTATLAAWAATLRYDCGDGERSREIEWEALR